MKRMLFLILMLSAIQSYGQKLGNYDFTIGGTYNPSAPVYGTWLRDPDGYVTILFRMNPMGFKHAMEEADRILGANNIARTNYVFDKTTRGADVTDPGNWGQWDSSIKKGNSEVRSGYMVAGKLLQIFLNDEGYQLNILGGSK